MSTLTGISAAHTSSPIAPDRAAARSASIGCTAPGSPDRGDGEVDRGELARLDRGSPLDIGADSTGIGSGAAVPDTFTRRKVTSGSHHGVSMRTSRLARLKFGSCGPSCSMIAFTLAPKEKT